MISLIFTNGLGRVVDSLFFSEGLKAPSGQLTIIRGTCVRKRFIFLSKVSLKFLKVPVSTTLGGWPEAGPGVGYGNNLLFAKPGKVFSAEEKGYTDRICTLSIHHEMMISRPHIQLRIGLHTLHWHFLRIRTVTINNIGVHLCH